ncbi:DNA polymerase III subunit gamma/tau [Coprobacter sp.]
MDNYIVSARKYRPSTFHSVVGQKALTQTLKNAISSGKLAHAYLFCGPRGVGKTTCARIFAKTINCLHPTSEGEACNECESCKAFNEQRSYNILELDAASNNSVDDIRQLTEQVRIPPQIGKYKVFIIDEVHMLSTAAFNAFLKTLEEPPHHALFILATTEKHKILPTILSRCQIYDFQRITTADTVEHLQYVASQEGVNAAPEALSIIAQKADGGMRDALSILDQVISFSNGNITYQSVIENLNVLDYEYYFRLTDTFLQNAVPGALIIFDQILKNGFEAQYFISGLSNHFRDLLVCKDPITLPLLEVGPSIAQRYAEQAAQCSNDFLYKAMELSNRCDLNYRNSNNKKLLVELTLIQLCQLTGTNVSQPEQQPPLQKVTPATQSVQGGNSSTISTTPRTEPKVTAKANSYTQPPVQQPVTPTQPDKPVNIVQSSGLSDNPATAPKPKPRTAPIPSISIKNPIIKQKEQVPETRKEADMNTPFDEDNLQKAWIQFTKTIPTETVLVNTMISCPPKMLNATDFEVVVDNKEQLNRLNERGTDLMQFLKSALKNTRISMRTRESEKQEMHKAFSQRERFDLMVQKNPSIMHLKDKFGLELA